MDADYSLASAEALHSVVLLWLGRESPGHSASSARLSSKADQ